jgi:hypothetical protein
MDKTEKLIDWEENERTDRNRNGIDDDIEPPIPDISAGSAKLRNRLDEDGAADLVVTGGDVDARFEAAQGTGDESAVSSMTTPEQNQVSDIGRAMGIEYADDEVLKVGEKERERDRHRWELDPASSEDYRDRVNDKT